MTCARIITKSSRESYELALLESSWIDPGSTSTRSSIDSQSILNRDPNRSSIYFCANLQLILHRLRADHGFASFGRSGIDLQSILDRQRLARGSTPSRLWINIGLSRRGLRAKSELNSGRHLIDIQFIVEATFDGAPADHGSTTSRS
jgi:hypothetical protein